ncbi:MAG: hypothetical protein AAFX87_19185 [Bacteroidota bacterium]
MSWVKEALNGLSEHAVCQVRPRGGSMRGRIEDGQLVTIQKIEGSKVRVDDVVFVKWKGNYLLHLAKDIKEKQVLIGNNLGKINGWIPLENVLGKVIQVKD